MSTAEDDIYSPARDYTSAQVLLGTVGWASREAHYDLGNATNGGHTLVFVTLYGPRTPGVAPLKGVAQGHEIICQIADGVFRIPPKGARAYVIIPAGMDQVAGAGVIVATVNPGSELQTNPVDGETVISAMGGGQAREIIKKDGSITQFTTDNNLAGGQSIYARTARGVNEKTGAPDGFTWAAPWGTLKFDPSGFHVVLKESGAEFHLGGMGGLPPPLDVLGSYCNITAGTFHAKASSAAVGIGTVQLANAQAVQAALGAIATALTTIAASADAGGTGLAAAAATTAAAALAAAAAIMTTTASADL